MDPTKARLAASSRLATFFEDADEEPLPSKTLDDAKLSQYTAGNARKSKREKEQEAAEAKKREEEAEAARAYAEFLDAFEGDGGGRRSTTTFIKADSQATYTPLERQTTGASRRHERRSPSPELPSAPKPKGKRAMDSFLEEIKRDQAEREAKFFRHGGHGRSVTAMAAYDGQSGSKDRGDPQTTNLFVANLPSNVTEPALGNFFAKAGPVGSVKIMWPRSDGTVGPGADMTASRRSKSTGLSGFVSFMTRRDAEEALREFDGFDWGGSILRVGWSKAVAIAARPMYVSSAPRPHRDARSRSPYDRRDSLSPERGYRRRSRSWDRSRSRSRSPRGGGYGRHRRDSRSRSPRRRRDSPEHVLVDDDVTDTFIRAVAVEVKGQGKDFEDNLMDQERTNTKYSFLRSHDRRNALYRKIKDDGHDAEPEFEDEGYNSVYSTDSAEDSERERTKRTSLGRLARKRFEAMLRALSGKRGEMARCMAFSLEHAEAAHEVADIIVASLLVDGTPVPRKVARLHLICDILHNSAASVPSAWKFRQEFQARLGIVFDHMANIYHSFPGRITADVFKKQILSVVEIWETWIVFAPEFTTMLRRRLEGSGPSATAQAEPDPQVAPVEEQPSYSSRFKTSTFKVATVPSIEVTRPSEDDLDGAPMDDLDGQPLNEDVDGEPLDGDVDGEPLADDVDGEPHADDVDGVSLQDDVTGNVDDDLDGEPMDDLDGEPRVQTISSCMLR